jgi:hypothetical protein
MLGLSSDGAFRHTARDCPVMSHHLLYPQVARLSIHKPQKNFLRKIHHIFIPFFKKGISSDKEIGYNKKEEPGSSVRYGTARCADKKNGGYIICRIAEYSGLWIR